MPRTVSPFARLPGSSVFTTTTFHHCYFSVCRPQHEKYCRSWTTPKTVSWCPIRREFCFACFLSLYRFSDWLLIKYWLRGIRSDGDICCLLDNIGGPHLGTFFRCPEFVPNDKAKFKRLQMGFICQKEGYNSFSFIFSISFFHWIVNDTVLLLFSFFIQCTLYSAHTMPPPYTEFTICI